MIESPRLRLRALTPGATYRNTLNPGEQWRGDFLMHIGLPVAHTHDFGSTLWHLRRM